jgi:uncharacterized protein YidB (DUF937 family)
MGLFDGVLGGIVGAEMANVVNGLIERHGGVSQLRSNGLGPTVNSWINEGPNAPIAPGDVHKAFGEQTLNELAAKSGMSTQELAQKLAAVLPHAVDALTPEGSVPQS